MPSSEASMARHSCTASRSSSSRASQATGTAVASAQLRSRQLFPEPAGATTSVSGASTDSSSRAWSRGRGSRYVGLAGGRSLAGKMAVRAERDCAASSGSALAGAAARSSCAGSGDTPFESEWVPSVATAGSYLIARNGRNCVGLPGGLLRPAPGLHGPDRLVERLAEHPLAAERHDLFEHPAPDALALTDHAHVDAGASGRLRSEGVGVAGSTA